MRRSTHIVHRLALEFIVGVVAFYDTDGILLNSVEVGVLPDMVTFTPDGQKVITANEGGTITVYGIEVAE